jgi:phage terminase small subunit
MGRPKAPPRVLSTKEAAFVVAVLECPSFAAAAAKAGVPERTARSWLTRPLVRNAINEARRQLLDAATTRMAALTEKAGSTLEAAMDLATPGVPWGVRTGAAKTVLELAKETGHAADLAKRMARFERLAEGKAPEGDQGDEGPDADLDHSASSGAETMQ